VCLAVPGKIVAVSNDSGIRMAQVDFGGIRRETCLEYLPEAGVGDYVVVHVGFAISKVDEEEAARTLADLEQLAGFAEEQRDAPGEPRDEVP
jgi:hydrogenase expression/formation protein HypC